MTGGNPETRVGHEPMVESDSELWTAARAGDRAAFGALFERHAKTIYNYCFRRTGSWSAAEDVSTQISSFGQELLYVRTTGNKPGFTLFRPESQLAAWVLYALDSRDTHVTSTSFAGHNAWALTLDFTPGDDYYDTYGARVDVIVDKETGLVLKLTHYENDPGYWTSIETIHDFELDGSISAADFTLAVPGRRP